jgi:hypothetical protein
MMTAEGRSGEYIMVSLRVRLQADEIRALQAVNRFELGETLTEMLARDIAAGHTILAERKQAPC